jgi:hypothetical protein
VKLPLITFASFAMSVVTSPVVAQSRSQVDRWIDRWAAENDVYVTQRVRREVRSTSSGLRLPGGGAGGKSAATNFLPDPLTVRASIEKFPIIRLIVEPTPPRDYSVTVNGEDCTGHKSEVYKVPTGNAEVRVERPGKPPCVWIGRVNRGQTQEVSCKL